jgi:hypothetical protein
MSDSTSVGTRTLRVLLIASLACGSCHRKPVPAPADSAVGAGSAPRPVDRLTPDELAAGTAEVWGLAIPRDMRIEHHFPEIAYVVGPVKPDALANYVRDRVVVSHVEIGAGRTIFPSARIKGGPPDHLYELDVIPEAGGSRLEIQDLTPVKVVPGLSDAERWRQAGLTPQGRPLDMKKFE